MDFAGIGFEVAAVENPLTTVVHLKHDQANDVEALQLMRYARVIPTVVRGHGSPRGADLFCHGEVGYPGFAPILQAARCERARLRRKCF